MCVSEWYSYHFPELKTLVKDNYMYARVAQVVGDRHQWTEDKLSRLEEIVMDSAKVKAIHDASRMSMGLSPPHTHTLWLEVEPAYCWDRIF